MMSSRVSASLRSPPCLAQYALIVPNGVSAFDSGRPSRNSDVVCRAVAMFASVLDVGSRSPARYFEIFGWVCPGSRGELGLIDAMLPHKLAHPVAKCRRHMMSFVFKPARLLFNCFTAINIPRLFQKE